MKTRRYFQVFCLVLLPCILAPPVVSAQTASIAGAVRDGTGGVLPGVTVEVASPALIEQSRVVFTDGQGLYRVIALVPGEYTVTFALPGFGTVIREGIVLTAVFAASVDVEMTVGGIAETIIVSGASPLVDVETVTQSQALTSAVIAELPTGRSFQNLGILVPGVQVPISQQDVGGADGANWQTMEVHGSRGDQMPLTMNGMPYNNMNNTGGGYNHTLAVNTGAVEEMTVTISGTDAENRSSGVVANTISKEGANQFSTYIYTDFVNGSMQSNNLSQALIDQGLQQVNSVRRVAEFNPAVGGPIIQDRLWFYAGYRSLVATQWQTGSFESKDPLSSQYCRTEGGCLYDGILVPDSRDFTKPAFAGDQSFHTGTLNLTGQLNPRNKVTAFYQYSNRHKISDSGIFRTPEATDYLTSIPNYLAQAKWTSAVTSRLLLEGGFTFFNETWLFLQQPEFPVGPEVISKRERSTGTRYAADNQTWNAANHQYNMRFAVNYVTGSHAFKVGMQDMWGTRRYTTFRTQAQQWDYLNGQGSRIFQYASPLEDHQKLRAAAGFYAQDRWTIDNVTVNLGVRFDFHEAYVPAQTTADLLFVAPISYAAVDPAPSWKDLSPRIGAAWDVFGTGRTVVRGNFGRYVASESVATATANNPVNTRINSAQRSWNDTNFNLVPDCDLTNTGANGECGQLSAPLGNPAIVTQWNPDVLTGFGVRPNDTEILVGLQQGLTEGLSMDVQWTRHWYGNFFATQNRATPASGFDSFCVTAPSDPRLPGGGGNEICGFMDEQPAFFGLVPDNLVTGATDFGNMTDVYTGIDVSFSGRFQGGGVLQGGVSTGRERTNFCEVIGSANIGSNASTSAGDVGTTTVSNFPSLNYCESIPPFQPDFKAIVSYPLPAGLNVSAVWQNRAGPQQLADFVFASTDTDLGRPLNRGSAALHLIQPGEQFGERVNQIDVRLSKNMSVGNGRVQVNAAFYNLLNTDATLSQSNRFGPNWLTPTRIMQGRMFKIGAQLDF
jgi:hypothetical protein